MKAVYPAIFTPAKEGGYDVFVPDFPLNTQGKDMADAIYMARDAIASMGIYYHDEKKELPKASALSDHNADDGGIVSLIDVDFDSYRKKHSTRTVRRNVTLPAWLDEAAANANINVSGVVQRALKAELHMD